MLGKSSQTNSRDRDTLVALTERRCSELEAEALPLGQRLYAEALGQFTKRIQRYWQTWKGDYRDTGIRQ
jgi:hypothetical protein